MDEGIEIGSNFLTMGEMTARFEVDGYIDVSTRGRVEVFIFDKAGNVVLKLIRKPADISGSEGWGLSVARESQIQLEAYE